MVYGEEKVFTMKSERMDRLNLELIMQEQIPYYHCICCDQPIDGLCVMIAMRRYPDMNKRCISCIKKIFNNTVKII